ncbi:transcription factor TGA2.3-like isoform X2 [Henckelia pumila]|uniref:transcription factor TGA2.3-like isoform X2 n=1 Tax=Henckelia pumila TaxID=405737 RepID=UPI003C6E82E5
MLRLDVAFENPTSDLTSYDIPIISMPNSPFFFSDESCRIERCFPNLGDLAIYDFPHGGAVNSSISSLVDNGDDGRAKKVSVVSDGSQFGGPNHSSGSAGMRLSVGTGHFTLQKGCLTVVAGDDGGCCLAVTNGQLDNLTFSGVSQENLLISESKEITKDRKAIRRLTQNREAARRSRQRQKAYVRQLENCNLRLSQLQQELQSTRKQAILGVSSDHGRSSFGNGDVKFDMDYARWFDEHQRLTNSLRSTVNSNGDDTELRLLIDGVMSHYEELFMLKRVGARLDVFHILSGMWKTPAERYLMWLGGFRSSNILKIIRQQIKPLVEQQFVDICNLQQCCQEAEDALSQGVEALQQSVAGTLFSHSLDSCTSAKIADYMGQMSTAMTNLASLEDFLYQADMLRQQTLQQLLQILTIRQAARALIVISDYKCNLRALNSLWIARPKE